MTTSPNPLRTEAAAATANPVLVAVERGAEVESIHRGAWALVDASGHLKAGAGDLETPVFTRSSIKALQALPLLESGAARRYDFDAADLALAVSSHNGEPCHTERAAAILTRLGLGPGDLRCGPQMPGDPPTRRELTLRGEDPGALHNNCSGKHAGFLALTRQLGGDSARYLEPDSPGQRAVRTALAEMTGLDADGLVPAVDGCSAPTYRLPLQALAHAFARFANPSDLPSERAQACTALADAVARHPVLIAGSYRRLCTDLAAATGGRLFPKIGAEGVYVVGVRGAGLGLAVKMDDGDRRGLHAVVLALVERLGLASPDELETLATWRDPLRRNRAGLEVGRLEVRVP